MAEVAVKPVVTIQLPSSKTPPKSLSPKLLILFGQQKVGKTTAIAQLDDCLIIDTEKGTDFVESMNVQVNGLEQYYDVIKAIVDQKKRYKYVVLDTLDKISDWYERKICKEQKVQALIDIPYGKGYFLHREGVTLAIESLKRICKRVIVVGHRKKSTIGEESLEVTEMTLDISGKLKNMLMADADAVGYMYRAENQELMITFRSAGGVEAGARCDHLRNKNMPLVWDQIYID